jgi:hypothetical protein
VANLNTEDLRRLARLGAVARLEQIRAEEEMIRSEFPELFGGTARGRGRGRKAAAPQASAASGDGRSRRRNRKPMTAAQRKAVSERMRRYWADRRKAKAGK